MSFKHLSGDIGLSTNTGWLAKTINWVQSRWTKNAKYSHAYAYIDETIVVEALSKIKLNPAIKYDNQKREVWRLPLTDKEREMFKICMLNRVNGAYGWLKYPGFILDASFTSVKKWFRKDAKPVFIFSKALGFSNIPVCSQLVVWGIHKATYYRFLNEEKKEVNWRTVTPDRLHDLLKLEYNEAILLHQDHAQ